MWPYVAPLTPPRSEPERGHELLIRRRITEKASNFIGTLAGLDIILPECPFPLLVEEDPSVPAPARGDFPSQVPEGVQSSRGPSPSDVRMWAVLVIRWNT